MNTRAEIHYAQNTVRLAVGNLSNTAETLDRTMLQSSDHAERIHGLCDQLWAMADLVRVVEHELAAIHATVRTEGVSS